MDDEVGATWVLMRARHLSDWDERREGTILRGHVALDLDLVPMILWRDWNIGCPISRISF